MEKEKSESSSHGGWREASAMLFHYMKRHRLRVAAGFLALIIVDFMQLLIPRVIKTAVDALQEGRATPQLLLHYGAVIMALAVFIAALRYVWRVLLLGFSRLVETDLREHLFSHILSLDRTFFGRRTTGEIMALATNDLSSVQLATGMGLVAAVDALFMGVTAMAFMAYIHPVLTAIALAPMPILALLTRLLAARLHRRFKRVQEQFSTMTEFVRAAFTSIRLIKAYNQEASQSRLFKGMSEAYIRDNLRLAAIYGTLFPIAGFIASVSLLLVLFFGGRLTLSGAITVGDFVAFISYLNLMTWPMMALGWVADLFQRGTTSLGRIRELLEERPELSRIPPLVKVGEGPGPALQTSHFTPDDMEPDDMELVGSSLALQRVAGRRGYARPFLDGGGNPKASPIEGGISLRGLFFTYPGATLPSLKDIRLDIPPGRFVGIVGRTGSGKTTLCHLLARLYTVPNGVYLLDGRDVNTLSLEAVRGAIAYVPQDVILFSDTIAFNISMGRPDATAAEIEAAARAAAIHEEIAAMKDGYETRIGERGVKLSGGQRQRVAIARALLLDRPILMIDDGLSAVDMETEHAIINSLADHLRGRTCIIVSHRVAPLAEAHEIVVMDRGRLVATGAHARLIETNSFYATIYRQQTEGGAWDDLPAA